MKTDTGKGRAHELASEHALLESRGAELREELREATDALERELQRVEEALHKVRRAATNPAFIALAVAIGVIAFRKGLFRHVRYVRHVPTVLMALNAARQFRRRA